jgi:hypothetical protein
MPSVGRAAFAVHGSGMDEVDALVHSLSGSVVFDVG